MFKVGFSGNTSAISQMDGATSKLKKTAENTTKKLENMGNSFTKVGKGLMAKVTLPIVSLGAASIKTVATFDDSMSKVKAISGATTDELAQMRNQAKDLGSTTAHSASAAADGMTILAAAGQKTNEILASTPHLLSLASASGLDLESSASILTGTLAQFSLKAESSQLVTDAFAKAASSANTNVGELGEAMTYAGGDAANMNMDIQKTNAILGVFANANLVGSRAGTTFSAMYKDLTAKVKNGNVQIGKTSVAVYDSSGKMKDMGTVLSDIEKATKGMTDAQRDSALQSVFQGQSMRGVNAFLTQGSEKYKELENAIYNSDGAATKMADDMEDNIGGAFRSMGSAIQGFMIEIGDTFKDDVRAMAEGIGNLARGFSGLDDGTKRGIVGILAFAAATGSVVWGMGKVIGIGLQLKSTLGLISTGVGLLLSPIGLIALKVGAVISVVSFAVKSFREGYTETGTIMGGITKIFTNAADKIKGIWSGLREFLKNPIKGTISMAGKALDKLTGRTKVDGSHRTGMSKIPYDGYIAEVHKDEAILPKGQAEEYRRGKQTKAGGNIVYSPSVNITVGQDVGEGTKRDLERTIKDVLDREREKFFYKLRLQ